jgi:6-phospho-beta-glucosidase
LTREFGRVPNSYLQYYYYREETLVEAQAASHTRAQQIMAALPDYYAHYRAEIEASTPNLNKVRGGSLFGDMAVDVLGSMVTDDGAIHTLNVLNGNALPGFDTGRVVELPCRLDRLGATPLAQNPLPHTVMGLLTMLAEYQWLAAQAIWQGTRREAIRALAANPLVLSLSLAETLLDEITPLQRSYISERLQHR